MTKKLIIVSSLLLVAACASQPKKVAHIPKAPASQPGVKIGKPYVVFGKTYVPADDRNYDEKGIASWYGPTFHSKPTATGEIYNQDDITAAHKTLPMPSWVEVTNMDNGRQLVVRINDRGPFVDGRIIDLSRRSAQLLGVDGPGLARVRVKRVFPEGDWARGSAPKLVSAPAPQALSPVPQALPPAPQVSSGPEYPGSSVPAVRVVELPPTLPARSAQQGPAPSMAATVQRFIQVAALSDEGRARALASVMADLGPADVQPAPGGLWRVRIGPVDSTRADTLLWDVRASGYPDARLVQ